MLHAARPTRSAPAQPLDSHFLITHSAIRNHTYPLQNKQNDPFLIGPILGYFSPIASRPTKSTANRTTKSKATRTASPRPTSDPIRGTLRCRCARSFMSELKLRPPTPRRTPFLIDNFGKSRAIRNHIQITQNKQNDQILIDNFLDPPPPSVDTRTNWKTRGRPPISLFHFLFSLLHFRHGARGSEMRRSPV